VKSSLDAMKIPDNNVSRIVNANHYHYTSGNYLQECVIKQGIWLDFAKSVNYYTRLSGVVRSRLSLGSSRLPFNGSAHVNTLGHIDRGMSSHQRFQVGKTIDMSARPGRACGMSFVTPGQNATS
jgi:hypothetical protein